MFIWDFDALFAVALIFLVGLVLTFWIRYNLSRLKYNADQQVAAYVKHCQYCAYVYLDYRLKASSKCPRCMSYHE